MSKKKSNRVAIVSSMGLAGLTLALALSAGTALAADNDASLDFSALGNDSNQAKADSQATEGKTTEQAQAQACDQDPRINQIGQIIQQIDAGNPPKKPLRLPAKDLLSYNPAILKRLKGNYVVVGADCSTTPVVGGQLLKKVPADYSTLANQLADAVENKDKDRIKYLVNNFKAAPIGPRAGLNLVSFAPFPKDTNKAIAQILDVREVSTYGNPSITNLANGDLFVRLGGKLTKQAKVTANGNEIEMKADNNDATAESYKPVNVGAKSIKKVLRNMGYIVQN